MIYHMSNAVHTLYIKEYNRCILCEIPLEIAEY